MQILSKTIKIKNLQIDIVLLWRISDVKQGLATGNNREYVFKEPDAVGPYRIIEPKNVLDETDINKIINDEELRIKIINDGISKKMFKGKTLVTLDKGGSSDIEEGRLSNYYAPTKFYIDWSEKSVRQMKTMTIAGWKKYYGEKNIPKSDENKIAAVLRNIDYYFKPGITFSPTGLYAPTFRLNTLGIFDHAGDGIFVKNEMKNTFSNEFLLGILCSKFTRYIQKNFLNNSVGVQVEDIKRNPIPIWQMTCFNCNDTRMQLGLQMFLQMSQ